MSPIASYSSERSFIAAVALCFSMVACKQEAENHYASSDSSQVVVASTSANSFKDSGGSIEAFGTWLAGSPFPCNKANLRADQKTMTLRIAEAIVVDRIRPPMLEAELNEYAIEEWTDEKVITTRTRCGKSERFARVIIDRKTKEIVREFTGEYPARIILGNGIKR